MQKEVAIFGDRDSDYRERNARAEFRRDFTTTLHIDRAESSDVLLEPRWAE